MNYLAIGNGEPCPFCDVILDDRPNHKGEPIFEHLKKKHKKEFMNALFPENEKK